MLWFLLLVKMIFKYVIVLLYQKGQRMVFA